MNAKGVEGGKVVYKIGPPSRKIVEKVVDKNATQYFTSFYSIMDPIKSLTEVHLLA